MQMYFPGLDSPVAFQGCDDIADNIAAILCDWPTTRTDDATTDPIITVRRDADGYRCLSPWADNDPLFPDPVDATCDLVADLVQAFAHENGLLCLHAAAIDFGGKLVVIPDTYRQGKSTLSSTLAYRGMRLFSDDVLPIEKAGTRGMAMGILPRVRLPLHDGADAGFRHLAETDSVLKNHRYSYFGNCNTHVAPHGTLAPIAAIVMLDRKDATCPELEPIKGSEALARLIEQNFAKAVPAPETLDRLHEIVAGADCFVLHYGESGEAAPYLIEQLGKPA